MSDSAVDPMRNTGDSEGVSNRSSAPSVIALRCAHARIGREIMQHGTDFQLFVAVTTALLSGVGLWLALYYVFARRSKQAQNQVEETLEGRLATVAESMARASELLTLVQTEIEARATRAKQLAAEVERGEQLALLTQAQKDAVAAVVRREIASEGRRSLWWTVGISGLTFVFGSAVTVLVTLLVHPLN